MHKASAHRYMCTTDICAWIWLRTACTYICVATVTHSQQKNDTISHNNSKKVILRKKGHLGHLGKKGHLGKFVGKKEKVQRIFIVEKVFRGRMNFL